ncbi:MAG TPA: HD domain-containing protein, partial [Solirubrobacteraceae bacterium]
VFVELRRIIAAEQALRGLHMLSELGAMAVVLPELEALRGVEQNRFHHADVHGHTLEVLERTIELNAFVVGASTSPGGGSTIGTEGESERTRLEVVFGEHRETVGEFLSAPLADGLTRAEALRWGALLHDAAKPLTRGVRPADGRVTFIGHDERGAALAREVLGRLRASERLRAHVAALVRNHLRLGFLVHEPQPLARRTVFSYLQATSPVEVDVTLLSIADRLATRGDRAQEAIDAHLHVAKGMLADALSWHEHGPDQPLLRGDELGAQLGIELGPRIGELLSELAEAQYAGEIATREQALAYLQAGAKDVHGGSE